MLANQVLGVLAGSGFNVKKDYGYLIIAIKPDLPVICVTGYSSVVEDREHCDMLLKKPYDTATLARALAQVIPGEIGA